MRNKLNKLLRITCVLFLIAPTSKALADHVPTQEPYGYEQSINSETGDLTIRLLGSDGFEDSPPEKYTIFFGMATGIDENSFCISTSFGHVQNQWSDHVFSITNLRTYFELPVGTFYYRVRSDNDTDNSYSTISTEKSIALPDQVPFNETQTDWVTPTSTCVDTSTTTTTTSSTTSSTTTSSTTTTSTTSTTTTTTLPPPPPPTTTTTLAPVIVKIGGEEVEYTQLEVSDGTVDRDIERQENEDKFGCFMTNAQIERGDCVIIIEEIVEVEEDDTKEELFNDVVVVDEVEDEFIEEEFIELTEQEIEELEKQMEFEVKELELKEEVEFFEFDSEEEAKEFIETLIEVEEFLEELEEVEVEEIVFEDIPKDIIIEIEDEIIEDELVEEVFTDESETETEVQEQVVEEEVELTEEEIQVEVEQVEEKIEAIQETNVEELETVQVVEIIKEVNDAGLENLAEVSKDVLEVVAQVVEEVITIAQEEELTEEQVEVVAEVLGFTETKDVQIIAEAVKTDENVAQAVDEFVERAIEFAKNDSDQEFTLADATTEIAFESFVASPVSVIIDIDLDAINLSNIANDMTTDQKEKAQEVIVPTILVRIVSFAMRRFD